jgi:carbon monoxide dehydrogenase subunit G
MHTVIIEINASPQIVFSWLEDPTKLNQWLPNIVENEIIYTTENKVGSTWRQVYEENGRRMEMFGTTTVHEPCKRTACEIKGKLFDLDVDYRLENLDGRTRLTQNSVVKMKGFFKLLGFILGPIMKKSQDKQADNSFSKLKRLAEAEAAVKV